MTTLTAIRNVAEVSVDPSTLLVAFASQEGDIVDQHFGSAQAFYLYRVNADHAELVAHQSFGYEKKDGNEDKLKPKLLWLAGADVVYCGSIGGSATRQLGSLGGNPLKGGGNVQTFLLSILDFVIKMGTIVVILMMVLVGYKFVAAQGEPGKITEARDMLLWTIVGALILLGSKAIALGIEKTVQALSTG